MGHQQHPINAASYPTQGVVTDATLHKLNYIALREISLSYSSTVMG